MCEMNLQSFWTLIKLLFLGLHSFLKFAYGIIYHSDTILDVILPFYKVHAPARLRLPVMQESTKSLKTLLVLHAKTFEITKPSIMQVIILK